jgi:hypothetical protein
MTTTELQTVYGIPAELLPWIDSGILVPLPHPKLDERTVKFNIPKLAYEDEKGRDFFFTLVWIHPDYNAEFCHYYTCTPGDDPNFYIVKETRNDSDEHVDDLESFDDLIAWLEDVKARK